MEQTDFFIKNFLDVGQRGPVIINNFRLENL